MAAFLVSALVAVLVSLLALGLVISLLGCGALLGLELLARIGKWPRKGGRDG